MKKILLAISISLVLIGTTVHGVTAQGTPPNIKVSLALDKTVYLLNSPIEVRIILENLNTAPAAPIITSEGFKSKPFHLFLTFIDPDGKGITANELGNIVYGEPEPPQVVNVGGVLTQMELVELIQNGWIYSFTLNNAHVSYLLTKAGRYSVKEIIPMRTYPSYQTIDGKMYAPIDSYDWADSVKSNTIYFSLVADTDGDGYYYPDPYGQYNVADCDDNNANVNPGATEILGNGIDDDCNPATEDGGVIALNLTMPNGGEYLPSGGIWGICWKAPNNAVKFDLKYSIDSGINWNFIKTVIGLRCTNWDIPVVTGNKKQCLVKVIGYDSNGIQIGEDVSDNPFTIDVLRVTSPNGGETLKSGSTWTITWQTYETTNPVAITELGYKKAGTNWKLFRTLTGNPGSCDVKVPYVAAPIKAGVAVRLKDASGNVLGTDTSDAAFTIMP